MLVPPKLYTLVLQKLEVLVTALNFYLYHYHGTQVKDCVNAFKIEKLPDALIVEINVLQEQYRNPMIFYAIDGKETIANPPWLK